jgi:hypothetical protein
LSNDKGPDRERRRKVLATAAVLALIAFALYVAFIVMQVL